MKSIKFVVICSVATLLLFGCSTNRQSRQLATDINSQSLLYESLVDKKVNAEKLFYKQQYGVLRNILLGNVDITVGVKTETTSGKETEDVKAVAMTEQEEAAEEKEKTKRSYLYGRNRVTMERDARITAENYIYAKGPKTFQTLINFAHEGVEKENALYLEILQRQSKLSKDLIVDQEKIAQQKELLKKIRKRLAKLSKPSLMDEGENLVKFGIAINELLEKEE